MRNLLVLMFMMFVVTSCSNDEFKVKVAKSIADTGAPIIAKAFTCVNEPAINAYLYDKLRASKILKPSEPVKKSLIVGPLCYAALEAVLPPLVDFGSKKLPADWQCTGEALENTGKVIAREVCDRIKI